MVIEWEFSLKQKRIESCNGVKHSVYGQYSFEISSKDEQ